MVRIEPNVASEDIGFMLEQAKSARRLYMPWSHLVGGGWSIQASGSTDGNRQVEGRHPFRIRRTAPILRL